MSSHDADLQAAVDSTSVAHDAGEQDLVSYLRDQLAERGVETSDDDWLGRTTDSIRADRNYVVVDEPSDFTPRSERG